MTCLTSKRCKFTFLCERGGQDTKKATVRYTTNIPDTPLTLFDLPVTAVREASGYFTFEAGALLLGKRGVCCIDYLENRGAEYGALLDATEQ